MPARARRLGPFVLTAGCTACVWATQPLRAQVSSARPAAGSATDPVVGTVVGTVRDSASGSTLAGAAVQLRDSLDRVLAQTVTDEHGRYALPGSPGARRFRVVRMGFRPADVPFTPGIATPRELALAAVPVLLAPSRARAAARCPRNTNTPAALGLLEQVRAGLLATVIGGAQQPRALTILSVERDYAAGDAPDTPGDDAETSRAVRQIVGVQTAEATASPFGASRTGAEFGEEGFRQDDHGQVHFYAPDAATLVDDGFAAAYCFRVVQSSDRATQLGLGFAAPRQRNGRVDVDGVLWVDTAARSLRELTFRYVGVSPAATALHAGGRLTFRAMPTGVSYIDRWSVRLVSGDETSEDTRREALGGSSSYAAAGYGRRERDAAPALAARDVGGELASVVWPDGRTWRAPLGVLRLQITDQRGRPATAALARLDGTEYTGMADSAGVIEFADLAPGPYTALVVDPALERLGRARPVRQRTFVARDTTMTTRLAVEMAERVAAAQVGRPEAGSAPKPAATKARAPRDTASVAIGDGKTIERLFTGRFAGVEVTQAADGGLRIRIRNAGSLQDEPLYLVDGTPLPAGTGGIVHLNPYDIEKIEVLKNAEDIALYGVRGRYGVIRITTTRPGRR